VELYRARFTLLFQTFLLRLIGNTLEFKIKIEIYVDVCIGPIISSGSVAVLWLQSLSLPLSHPH